MAILDPNSLADDARSYDAAEPGKTIITPLGGAKDPGSRCLGQLLSALEWAGEPRYVHEAIGVDMQVFDIHALRIVLSRLGFSSHKESTPLKSLTPSMMPCLFVPDGYRNDIWIVLGHEDDGQLKVYKGGTNVLAAVPAESYAGCLYSIQKTIDSPDIEKNARKSWFASLVSGETETIRTLVWLTFAVNVVALAVPIYMIAVFDKAVATKSVETLGFLFGGILLVLAVEFLLREMRTANLAYLGARMEGLLCPLHLNG